MLNRRKFIQGSAAGLGGALIISQIDCGGKSVAGVVAILSGAVSELKLIFPTTSGLDKIIKLATDFNNDWVAGKFASARVFFTNLDTVVEQVMGDLGVGASTRAKLLLATLGIAVRTIAALIAQQATATPGAVSKAKTVAPGITNRIEALASDKVADQLLRSVRATP